MLLGRDIIYSGAPVASVTKSSIGHYIVEVLWSHVLARALPAAVEHLLVSGPVEAALGADLYAAAPRRRGHAWACYAAW